MDPDSVADILSRLSVASDEDRRQLLNNIRPALDKQDSRTLLKPLLESSDLSVLFDVLNSSDEDTIESGYKVLKIIFEFVDPAILLTRYGKQLTRCLDHPNSEVKISVLRFCAFAAAATNESVTSQFLQNESLIVGAAKCVFDESTGVAENSGSFLVASANLISGGEPIVFGPLVLPFLAEAVDGKNAVIKMRIYEVMVRIAKISEEMTERVSRQGFLQRLCSEVQEESDILSQLNAIEILSDLAESSHGFRFLETQQVLSEMDRLLNKIASDTFADLVLPGFIKFFGHICHQSPHDFGHRFPNFYGVLVASLADEDRTKQILAIETAAHIGMTSEGRKEIREIGSQTVEPIRKILDRGIDNEKVRVLSAFGDLMRYTESPNSEELSEYFFNTFGASDLMKKLISLIKLPFSDLSSAAYNFLIRMSRNNWSLKKFAACPGFIELLLDRTSAREKSSKELKYDLIRVITDHPAAGQFISDHLLQRMKQYVKEGAFYVESQPEVAFEGGDD